MCLGVVGDGSVSVECTGGRPIHVRPNSIASAKQLVNGKGEGILAIQIFPPSMMGFRDSTHCVAVSQPREAYTLKS